MCSKGGTGPRAVLQSLASERLSSSGTGTTVAERLSSSSSSTSSFRWSSRAARRWRRRGQAVTPAVTLGLPSRSPLIQDRHFRTLAPVPFHREVPSLDRPAGRSGLKVALFTGCLIDKMFPAIAHGTIKVLNHLGVGIYLPENQGCCGIPALSSGDLPTFHKLMAHNLRRFEAGEFDVLVTACATCTSTIHEMWPIMAHERDRKAAGRLARRTLDINQFLVREAGLQPLAGPVDEVRTVTYHDPCHLKKSLKVFSEPRAVIDATPGCTLTEMAEPNWCCGMGGSFNLQYYDISRGIGQKKAQQIKDTGADILATGCPACMIQISDMLSQAGANVAVRHPIELLADALGK